MISRLEKLESGIANGISRGEEMDYIRQNLDGFFTPGEFYEIYAKLAGRAKALKKSEDLP